VVSKVSRFGRSLLSGLAAIERVKAAGGQFVSVQDGLDTSTDSGRLVLHILLSLAEWEGDRIRAEWDQARASAIKRGVYMSAGSPVGYRRTRSGRLRPAPEAAAAIAEVFRRRAQGESFSSLARWFEQQGVRTAYGNPGWTSISMAKLVRSPVYLGQIRDGPYVNDRAHPPLVDAATWPAAQHPRRVVLVHELQPALLARLVRCAGCSLTMSAYGDVSGFAPPGDIHRVHNNQRRDRDLDSCLWHRRFARRLQRAPLLRLTIRTRARRTTDEQAQVSHLDLRAHASSRNHGRTSVLG
jgi:site-specific DNA recombinase